MIASEGGEALASNAIADAATPPTRKARNPRRCTGASLSQIGPAHSRFTARAARPRSPVRTTELPETTRTISLRFGRHAQGSRSKLRAWIRSSAISTLNNTISAVQFRPVPCVPRCQGATKTLKRIAKPPPRTSSGIIRGRPGSVILPHEVLASGNWIHIQGVPAPKENPPMLRIITTTATMAFFAATCGSVLAKPSGAPPQASPTGTANQAPTARKAGANNPRFCPPGQKKKPGRGSAFHC